MSCLPLTPDQLRVLDLLARGQLIPEDLGLAVEELVRWGWVMASGELTGVGWTHARGDESDRVGINERT